MGTRNARVARWAAVALCAVGSVAYGPLALAQAPAQPSQPSPSAHQQSRDKWPVSVDPASVATGNRDEESLLLLQLAGRAPMIQTSIRSFSAFVIDTLVSLERPRGSRTRKPSLSVPSVSLWYNTRRATDVDGPVWAGRGATAAFSLGAVGWIGSFSWAVRPVGFWSQNSAFDPPLLPRAVAGSFATPVSPASIDLPYRFGDKSYGRLDLGDSWFQYDTRWVVAGVSTATQGWGPMHIYPLLLGPNAGGFPHLLVGSGLPWNVGIGRLGMRVAVGRLDASAYAPRHPGDARRLASELVAVFTPKNLDGLELGAGRFFHRRWPEEGIDASVLRIPFEALLKNRLPTKDDSSSAEDDQLLSVFFRLAEPKAGVEVYGEFLREDHSFDYDDLIREPDHSSAWALGLRRIWQPRAAGQPLKVFTVEATNGRISHLIRLRGEGLMYTHSQIREGHTLRGQLLGSPAVFGGSGLSVKFSRHRTAAGWSAMLRTESIAQNREGGTWSGTPIGFHSVEVERRWAERRLDLTAGVRGQIGWNALSRSSNVGLSLTMRPIARVRLPVRR